MKFNIKRITYFIIIIMSSTIFADYNTYFIGLTQLKVYERMVIFSLFLLMGLSIFYYIVINKRLFNKIIEIKISKYIIILSIFLSIIVIKVFEKEFIIPTPQKVDLAITALADKSENSMGSEVWISDIKKANSKMSLSEISLTEGWSINQGCLLAAANKPSTINIFLYADKEINIDFIKHNYSGMVKIVQDQQEKIVDLYDSNGDTYTYTIEPNGKVEYYGLRVAEIAYLIIMLIMTASLYMLKKSKCIRA